MPGGCFLFVLFWFLFSVFCFFELFPLFKGRLTAGVPKEEFFLPSESLKRARGPRRLILKGAGAFWIFYWYGFKCVKKFFCLRAVLYISGRGN